MKKRIWMILACVLGVLFAIFLWKMDIPHWQKLDMRKLTQIPQTSVLYDRNGTAFGTLYANENRVRTELEEVPIHVQNAFLAAEDQRFYEHSGFDIVRIFGALWADVRSMRAAQGASTITQQLIKRTHLTDAKTISRKAQEIVLAAQLENEMSKADILECYLNTVYFGRGAYGIQTAAQAYFGKNVGELSIAEGAMLAGIIKAPSKYAPHIDMEASVTRRNRILDDMAECGWISAEESEQAKREQPVLAEYEDVGGSWYRDSVLAEALKILDCSDEELLAGGYRIDTEFDPAVQSRMDALFADGANFPDPASDGTPCQAAMAVLNAKTGGILALEGGREYEVRRGLNRATDIRRQPGSTFKPVSTYAAALEAGYLPSSMLDDTRRMFADDYMPNNAGGKYYGTVTMREALSRSLNVATVDLAEKIGIRNVREYARRFGIALEESDANLSLALGSLTYGVSPTELCAAYCALANGGMNVTGHTISRIADSNGNVVYEYAGANKRAVGEDTAYFLTDMLKTAAQTGSAKALSEAGVTVAGKTGTVGMGDGQTRDIWTAAYTPNIAVCAWMGFDEPSAQHAMPSYLGGSGFPAKLCAKLLSGMELSDADFVMPNNLRRVVIDSLTSEQRQKVVLANEDTPSEYIATEVFPQNAVPTDVTDAWEAPKPPDDVSLTRTDGKNTLSFTCRDANAEYVVMRRDSDGNAEALTALSGEAGTILRYEDASANPNAYYAYTILPRHRLLYERGITRTGTETEAVSYSPGGFLMEFLNKLAE